MTIVQHLRTKWEESRLMIWRIASFALIGFGLGYLGLLLMDIFESWGFNEHLNFFTQYILMLLLNFVLSQMLTWRDSRGNYWKKFRSFVGSRLVTTALNQALFSFGIGVLLLPRPLVYFATLGLISVLNFMVSHMMIFTVAPTETAEPIFVGAGD